MKNFKQLLLLAILYCVIFTCCYCVLPNSDENNNDLVVNVSDTFIDMEDYVVRVVASEMPASFEMEALKAQCVAVRSYAIAHGLNVDTTTNTQVYQSEEYLRELWNDEYDYYLNRIEKAAKETYNEVMYYNDEVISAYYFAASNGTTSVSEEYFQESLPYLKSVSSSLALEDYSNAVVTTSFTEESLKKLLNVNNKLTLSIISRYDTNRVKEIKVNNKVYSGKEFRELLNLRSSDFSLKKTSTGYDITTKGYGHGVGMSQYGANGLAKKGYSYKEILEYYYKDIIISEYIK